MKKFILGLMAVLCTVVTAFAFTKPDHNKKFAGPYYFAVSNTVGINDFSGATLTFPSSVPPTSWSGCSGTNVHMCSLGFAGYKQVGSTYQPADAVNGTVITDYSQRTARQTKN